MPNIIVDQIVERKLQSLQKGTQKEDLLSEREDKVKWVTHSRAASIAILLNSRSSQSMEGTAKRATWQAEAPHQRLRRVVFPVQRDRTRVKRSPPPSGIAAYRAGRTARIAPDRS